MSYTSMGAFDANKVGCGTTAADIKWTQTALQALGFNPGPLDGIWGQQSAAAFGLYAASKLPQGYFGNCDSLKKDYAAKLSGQPGAAPPPPGTCPADQVSFFGMCVPKVQIPGVTPGQPPPPGAVCPPGTVGIPPICVAQPGQPPYAPPTAQKRGLTTNQKLAIGGIAVAMGVVALGVVFGRKKPARPATPAPRVGPTGTLVTPNRRRRRRARRNLKRRRHAPHVRRTIAKHPVKPNR